MTTTNLFDTYDTNTTYTTNDVVFFNGNIYQANVVCQGIIPSNSSYWRLISDDFRFNGISFKGVWSNLITYNAGEYVTSNGLSYISNSNNNVNQNPNSSSLWTPFNISLVISQPGDIQYQGANGITRLSIGNTQQVLAVSPSGFPSWTDFYNLLPAGSANQILTLTANGQTTWSSSIISNSLNTGSIISNTLAVGQISTSGNTSISGNLNVTGTTTTTGINNLQSTTFANVLIANTFTTNTSTSNTITTGTITSNTLTSNTITVGVLTSNTTTTNVLSSNTSTSNNLTINDTIVVREILETTNIQNIGVGNTMNILFTSGGTGSVFYYTANSTSNVIFNFARDNNTTLNSYMANGQSLSCAILVTQGATAYIPTQIRIDGANVTPKWSGNNIPTSGNPNSIDVYSFSIIKIGNQSYTVLGSATRFT